MQVQDVLRAVVAVALFVNENLLSEEADGVWYLNPNRGPIALEIDIPWVVEKQLDVPQLLRDNARNFDGSFAPVLAVVFTANQRGQELRA